jgi:hypothetical protein
MTLLKQAKVTGAHHVFSYRNQMVLIDCVRTFKKLFLSLKRTLIRFLELVCIDKIGSTKFVSKFDLFKGYWQVLLTERAKKISAYVTPDGLFQYKVMPFGMKNAPATF